MQFNLTSKITSAERFNPEARPTSPDQWTLGLAFSAAVWLSQKLNKPILKITNASS